MGATAETVRRLWTASLPPEPGDVLRVRGLGVAVVEELNDETIVLRLDQDAMTVRLQLDAAVRRLVPLVPARRLRQLLRTLEEPGALLSRYTHTRAKQLQHVLRDGEPADWIALLRSYATTAKAA